MSRLYDKAFNAGPQPIFRAHGAKVCMGGITGEPYIVFGLAAADPAVYFGSLRELEELRERLDAFLAGEYARAMEQ